MLSEEEQLKVKVWEIPGFNAMCEYPFVHDEMTLGEYKVEKAYYAEHYQEVRTGEYQPLWKQRKADGDK